MNNNIYDLSRFPLDEACQRLIKICNTYNRMCQDINVNSDYETFILKKELQEAIPLLKKDIISRINDL
jgi:hypothetical protein